MKRLCRVILYRFIPYCFLYPFFKVFGRLEVKGIDNVRGEEGIIIASNHLSWIDPPLLATVLRGGCKFMAKHELFRTPLLKYLIQYYAIPVNRDKPGASTMKAVLSKLAVGEKIIIFPEGSRRKGRCYLSPKKGIGMVAVISGKKVVPVLVKGTDELFPADKVMPRPARISVIFGAPLDLSGEGGDYGGISNSVMDAINRMAG